MLAVDMQTSNKKHTGYKPAESRAVRAGQTKLLKPDTSAKKKKKKKSD